MLDQYKEPEVEEIIYLQFLHYKVIENENLKNFKRRNVEEWSQVRNLIERMEKFLKSANA